VELRSKINRHVMRIKFDLPCLKLGKINSWNGNFRCNIWETECFLPSWCKYKNFDVTFARAHVRLIFKIYMVISEVTVNIHIEISNTWLIHISLDIPCYDTFGDTSVIHTGKRHISLGIG